MTVISVGAQKPNKIPHLFVIKALKNPGIQGTQVSYNRSMGSAKPATLQRHDPRSSKIRVRHRWLPSPFLLNVVLQVSVGAIRKK